MGFVAGDEVDPLDFDFTKFGGPKGTIPEPSQEAVTKYFRAMARMSAEQSEGLRAKRYEVSEALAKEAAEAEEAPSIVDLALQAFDENTELGARELDAIAELCSGTPSRADLDLLPARVQKAFAGWLVGQFVNPQSTTVTRPSLAVVRGA